MHLTCSPKIEQFFKCPLFCGICTSNLSLIAHNKVCHKKFFLIFFLNFHCDFYFSVELLLYICCCFNLLPWLLLFFVVVVSAFFICLSSEDIFI